jgi:tetratricopeptide (TPR) repeat protein/predicted Ser/Thr protein kinase
MREVESTLADSPALAERARRALGEGETVGRFVVEGLLGTGAMGVVYVAHDPRLGRRVALKLVRAERSSDASRARMLREAQAMARLAHPNVVVVYDAGTVDDQVFIAMELVDGTTLDVWLRAGPRGWRETLALLVQAGRGLSAAHAAGIVHRDFKPANVLVGVDGRARVTDFGLARDAGEELPGGDRPPLAVSALTETGAVLGTPAYMAPEQLRGEPASALADQYAFCVSLAEALYGERPPREGPFAPRRGAAPAAVRRAIARGLARAPGERWPTIGALLDALVAAARPRRAWIAGAGLLVVAGGVALALPAARREEERCDARPRLAGVWDAERKAALARALAAEWPAVETTLDAYTGRWVARRDAVCAGGEPPDVKQARLACLDQRLDNLRGWVGLFTRDAGLVAHARGSARARDDLAMCDEAQPMLQPVPEDPALRAKVARLRAAVAVQGDRLDAGEYREAHVTLIGLGAAARALGYLPVEAELANKIAYMYEERDELDKALPWFRRTAELAEEARYDFMRVKGWLGQAFVLDFLYRYEESNQAVSYAEAALKPMSGRQVDRERARLEEVKSLNAWGLGKLDEAIVHARRVTEAAITVHGPDSAGLASALFTEGSILNELDRLDEAEAAFHRADAIYVKVGGEGHPMRAKVLNWLGVIAGKRGDHEAALRDYRRALELKRPSAKPRSFTLAVQHANIGGALVELGRPDEALAELVLARAIVLERLGPRNEAIAEISTSLGRAQLLRGRPAEAIPYLEEALVARGDFPRDVAVTQFALARALWESRRDRPRARALAEQAKKTAAPRLAAEIDAWRSSR